jgi:HNH endonuclease
MYSDQVSIGFWNQVDREAGPDACWEWRGRQQNDGIGYFSIPGVSSSVPAHRVAYQLTHGRIPPGHLIWRTCKNSQCVNPHHLHAGDRAAFTEFLRGS